MIHRGQNSEWLWREWVRQCREARAAIEAGRYSTATAWLDEADETSRQLGELETKRLRDAGVWSDEKPLWE